MPVSPQFDIVLNGRGYMLARGQFAGRAWHRIGRPNAVQPFVTNSDAQRNALAPETDFVATYDDFSGGYGDAYRSQYVPNRYHWSENFDPRFQGQLIHAQGPRTLRGAYNNITTASGVGVQANALDVNGTWVLQTAPTDVGAGVDKNTRDGSGGGRGTILITGAVNHAGNGYMLAYYPTGLAATGREFDRVDEAGIIDSNWYRPATFGSFNWFGTPYPTSISTVRRRQLTGGINAITSLTTSVILGHVFAVAGDRMWKGGPVGPNGAGHYNSLQSIGVGSDPTVTANWSATLTIGNSQNDILDMIALDQQLYVSMQDGLYAGDTSGTFVNVLGEVSGQAHPENGRHLTLHDGGVIYPYTGGLIKYVPSNDTAQADNIAPTNNSQRSPVRGRYRTVASYAGWLYAGKWNGSQSFIEAGRDRGDGNYIWHTMQRMPHDSVVGHLNFDSVSAPSGGGIPASGNTLLPPRMWVLSSDLPNASLNFGAGSWNAVGSTHIYWLPIPQGNNNPLGEPNFRTNYCGSARMDFGRDNRGAPETLKVLRRTEINTDASTFLSGSRYADIYYTLDGGARTLLGRAQNSPKSVLYYPAGDGSFVTCYDFEISIESFTGSLNQTPVYRSVVTHGAFLTQGTDEITAVLDMATGRADRMGTPMRPAAQQLGELRALEGGVPVALIDLSGAMNWVTVQDSVEETENFQEGSDDPEIAATVRMAVQSFSGSYTG